MRLAWLTGFGKILKERMDALVSGSSWVARRFAPQVVFLIVPLPSAIPVYRKQWLPPRNQPIN